MNYKLIQGDCVTAMKSMNEESIDFVITSPPYDNLRTYNNSSVWNFDVFKNVANELYRVLKNGAIMVWIVADSTKNYNKSLTSFKQALYFQEIGMNVVDVMIWEKPTFTDISSTRYRYPNVYEYMFILSKGKPRIFNPLKDRKNKTTGRVQHGTKRQPNGSLKKLWSDGCIIAEYGIRYNVWQIPAICGKERTGHPAQFPIRLIKDHMISWSNEGDVVLDPFMGSGTTGVACKELGRNFIGIEIDNEYFDIAKKRIDSIC